MSVNENVAESLVDIIGRFSDATKSSITTAHAGTVALRCRIHPTVGRHGESEVHRMKIHLVGHAVAKAAFHTLDSDPSFVQMSIISKELGVFPRVGEDIKFIGTAKTGPSFPMPHLQFKAYVERHGNKRTLLASGTSTVVSRPVNSTSDQVEAAPAVPVSTSAPAPAHEESSAPFKDALLETAEPERSESPAVDAPISVPGPLPTSAPVVPRGKSTSPIEKSPMETGDRREPSRMESPAEDVASSPLSTSTPEHPQKESSASLKDMILEAVHKLEPSRIDEIVSQVGVVAVFIPVRLSTSSSSPKQDPSDPSEKSPLETGPESIAEPVLLARIPLADDRAINDVAEAVRAENSVLHPTPAADPPSNPEPSNGPSVVEPVPDATDVGVVVADANLKHGVVDDVAASISVVPPENAAVEPLPGANVLVHIPAVDTPSPSVPPPPAPSTSASALRRSPSSLVADTMNGLSLKCPLKTGDDDAASSSDDPQAKKQRMEAGVVVPSSPALSVKSDGVCEGPRRFEWVESVKYEQYEPLWYPIVDQDFVYVHLETSKPETGKALKKKMLSFGVRVTDFAHTRSFFTVGRRDVWFLYFSVDERDFDRVELFRTHQQMFDASGSWMNAFSLENMWQGDHAFIAPAMPVSEILRAVVLATRYRTSDPNLDLGTAIEDKEKVMQAVHHAKQFHGIEAKLTPEGQRILSFIERGCFR
ncbi:hypothetical protein B9Z55_008544 [Caenorhabditis nigoni]|uniref:Uncharacterized protein n=1 Tax=Caenorhabditis nigoni TaxID=1611254 RepID=A0A2G5UND6_9PELO|nr:hypothetical protein B9Z55_008544 [Caenorhabditis nigoni]